MAEASGNAPVPSVFNTDWTTAENTVSRTALQPAVPSAVQSRNSGGTAQMLPEERKRATFDTEAMTNFLDGGKEKTARRRWIVSASAGRDVSNKYNMSHEELLAAHVEHFVAVHDEYLGVFVPTREDVGFMNDNTQMSGGLLGHFGLFLPTLLGQASAEQLSWWLPPAFSMKIVGAYAQTELGHGSNVRGLQTVATFDRATQQFVIDTPTLQSIKWWPSGIGKVATHALVFAQLVLDGKEHGVHVFFVQVRDDEHRPLPGFEVGDLGTKLGDHSNDTGFLRMDRVRVDRRSMLSKYQEVTPDGQYVRSVHKTTDKLHYTTMVIARSGMVRLAGGYLARAATIAMRYSLVRRQGFVNTSQDVSFRSEERQLADYQVQRYRLFKQVAATYAFKVVGRWLQDEFAKLEGEGGTQAVIQDTAALPEVAASAAGLKALSTVMASDGIEDLRKSCGGNGYLLHSGIAALGADYLWQVSAEGDFVVLMLQSARFLVKSVSRARAGEVLQGPVAYLNALSKPGARPASPPEPSLQQLVSLEVLIDLLRHRALTAVRRAVEEMDRKTASGLGFDDAWNSCSLRMVHAAREHTLFFSADVFARAASTATDPALSRVLTRLARMFAVAHLREAPAGSGVCPVELERAVELLLDELRPDAAALVDAFDIDDRILNSSIGLKSGNVYEALWDSALRSTFNRQDPFHGYNEFLRPRVDLDFLRDPASVMGEDEQVRSKL